MNSTETVTQTQPKEIDLGYPAAKPCYFNGIRDKIDIPYDRDFNPTSFTVEMWVQYMGGRGYQAIFTSVSGSGREGRQGYLFCMNLAQQWQFWLGSGQPGVFWTIITDSKAQKGEWTHLAGTYNSESQTTIFYVNGVAVGQRTGVRFEPSDRNPLHVAAGATEQPGASPCYFHGSITQIRVWNNALSPTKVKAISDEGLPTGKTIGEGTSEETGGGTHTTGKGSGSGTDTSGEGSGTDTSGKGSGTDASGKGSGSGTDASGEGSGTDASGEGSGSGTDTSGEGSGSGTDTSGEGSEEPIGGGTGTTGEGEETPKPQEQYSPQPVLSFDGKDDFVGLGKKPAYKVEKDITLEAWIYPEKQQKWSGIVSNVYDTSTTESGYGLLLDGSSGIYLALTPTSNNRIIYLSSGANTLELNQWHHIAGTYDGEEMKIYIDGVEIATKEVSSTGINYNPENDLRIGIYKDNNDSIPFQGKIAEVRVWNIARSQEALQKDMQRRLVGNEEGLVAYWRLDEGEGDAVEDKTPSDNNGSINGATWEESEVPLTDRDGTGEETGEGEETPTEEKTYSPQPVLMFDGIDDYIDTGLDAQPSALPETTWEAWIKPTRGTNPKEGGWEMILSTDDGGWDRFVAIQNNRLKVSHGTNAWDVEAADLNSWQHIAVVYTRDKKIKFYKNGVEYVYSGTTAGQNTTKTLQIARSPRNAGMHYYQGYMSEVRVWDTARTPEQITDNMHRRLVGNEEGLVGYWRLDEGSGDTIEDKTAGDNSGTINGASWEESEVPIKSLQSVLTFDGEDDRVELPLNSIPTGNEITVSFWTYGEAAEPKNGSIIAAVNSGGDRLLNIHMKSDGSWVGFDCGSDGDNYDRIEKTAADSNLQGQWVRWAFTKNAATGEMKIYLNGELWHSETGKTLPLGESQTVRLGNYIDNQNQYQGAIRELAIWDKVLSAEEIETAMNSCLSGNEEGLVGYWSLNEATGIMVYDKTANNNHGAIKGATWKEVEVPAICGVVDASQWESDDSVSSARSLLVFDGQDDTVELPKDPFENNTTFTISLWIKPYLLNSGWHGFIGKQWGEPHRKPSMWVAPSNNGLHYDSYSSEGGDRYSGVINNFFENTEQWIHVSWVKEGTEYKFYRNGELFAIGNAPEAFQTRESSYLIGGVDNFFSGEIGEVSIWSIPRTLEEIRGDLQRTLEGNETGLTGYWSLNEGNSELVSDKGKNANSGTVKGASWKKVEVPVAGEDSGEEVATGTLEPLELELTSGQSVLTFDGRDDRVELPLNSIPTGNEITVSFWTKGDAANAKNGSVIAAVNSAGQRTLNIHMKSDGSWVGFDCGSDADTKNYDRIEKTAAATNLQGQWSRWTFTKNAATGEMKIYANGELWHSGTGKTLPLGETQTVCLGNYIDNRNSYQGAIRELAVWDKVRTPEEIKAGMKSCLEGNEEGLVGYWSLNEATGIMVYDKTEAGNHGAIKGASWQEAEVPVVCAVVEASKWQSDSSVSSARSVLVFDGQDDTVELPKDPFENNTTFTISLWIKPSVLNSGWHGFIGKNWGEAHRKPSMWVAPNNNGLHYDSYSADGSSRHYRIINNFFEAPDKWVHIAWVKDGKEYKVYRNGELFAIGNAPETFYTRESSYLIGGVDNFFAGEMSEVSIWSIARTLEEIRGDMQRSLTGSEAGLSYYWQLNEGSGETAHDRANAPNDGSIQNGTWEEAELPIPSGDSETTTRQVLTFKREEKTFIEVKDPFKNDTTFTICLWVKVSAVEEERTVPNGIIGKDKAGDRKPSLLAYTSKGKKIILLGRSSGDALVQEFCDVEEWVHIAWVKEGTEQKFYRNGELFATKPVGERFSTTANTNYWIGRVVENDLSFFDGQMAEISIWSVARTEAEIKADMYRSLTGDEPGLSCYWPLNEGSGDIASDMANRPNNGTITGATWKEVEVPLTDETDGGTDGDEGGSQPSPTLTDETGTDGDEGGSQPSPTPTGDNNLANSPNDGNIHNGTWQEAELPIASGDSETTTRQVLTFQRGQKTFVEINDPFKNNTTFTISLWLKFFTIEEEEYSLIFAILGKLTFEGEKERKPRVMLVRAKRPGKEMNGIQSEISDPSYNEIMTHNEADFWHPEEWVHLAWVKEGTEQKFYRNGELFATKPAPETFYKSNTSYWIGRNHEKIDNRSTSSTFDGQMAEISVWSVARTEAEIKDDMHRRLNADEPGLSYYWPLDEGSGETANDRANSNKSGGSPGTDGGGATTDTTDGEEDSATPEPTYPPQPVLSFDGIDDLVNLGKQPNAKIEKELTLETWVYIESDGRWPNSGIVTNFGESSYDESGYGLLTDDASGMDFILILNSNQRYIYLNSGAIEQNKWHHVAATYNGEEMKIYVDGVETASQVASSQGIIYNGESYLKLGIYENLIDDENYYFQGKIAEVRIWNIARTQEDIQKDLHRRLEGSETGLVGYWPLNEGSGEIANDKTSDGDRGTINGATWQEVEVPLEERSPTPKISSVQPVLVFDGKDDVVKIQDPFKNNRTFTIELWIKPSVLNDEWRGIIGKEREESPHYHKPSMWVLSWGNAIGCHSHSSNGTKLADAFKKRNFFEAPDKWVHVAWVKKGQEYRLYRNGELFAIEPAPKAFYKSKSNYLIGHASKEHFAGQITEVRIWSIARTQKDIQKDQHHRLKGTEAGLVGYWQFNEGSGKRANDKAPHANHGTIKGATWEQVEVPLISINN